MICCLVYCLLLAITFVLGGCGSAGSNSSDIDMSFPDPDKIVPARTELIASLTKEGYEISELDTSPVSSISVDRVLAEKGNSFIDITYGLKAEETQTVFDDYVAVYEDYYIIAINGNYVYCIGDKNAFKSAGFTSMANVGEQRIHE